MCWLAAAASAVHPAAILAGLRQLAELASARRT